MQTHDPQAAVSEYLLHSSRLGDGLAQAGSISLLQSYDMAHDVLFIVTYMDAQRQHICASIIIHQAQPGSWEFANFFMMGGFEDSPRLAKASFSRSIQ